MENNKNKTGYRYSSVTINNNNTQHYWKNGWSSRLLMEVDQFVVKRLGRMGVQ